MNRNTIGKNRQTTLHHTMRITGSKESVGNDASAAALSATAILGRARRQIITNCNSRLRHTRVSVTQHSIQLKVSTGDTQRGR